MNIVKLNECGYNEALLGTSLSRNQDWHEMDEVLDRLAHKQGGHNKALEFIAVWLDITAPRYFWQQLSTYRIGNSWLSESTMYTILKKPLDASNFEHHVSPSILDELNRMIELQDFEGVKNALPEGFLQRRIMVTNYKALQNIYNQRVHHKLPEWRYFCVELIPQLNHPEFIVRP